MKLKTNKTLSSKVISGASLQIVGGGSQTVIRILASMVLARTLSPIDFGIFGMALLTRELLEYMSNLGMGAGLIAKKNITDVDLSTCFWTMAGVRVIFFFAAYCGAPLVASFFHEALLLAVFRAISFSFLFTIVSFVPLWLLQKELKFMPIVIIRFFGVLIESSVAVFLVLWTSLGIFSLVFSFLLSSLFINVAPLLLCRWVPRFEFSKESFNYLFRFGINGLGTSLMTYVYENLDYWVVGKVFGSANLGLYEFAYRIPHIIQVRLALPVTSVIFPALAKLQDDNVKLSEGILRSVKYIAYIVFPMLSGLAVLSPLIITVLWGNKWLPIVIPLKILCFSSALGCVLKPVSSLFLCKHRPDIPFKVSIISTSVAAMAILFFGNIFGLVGIAIGVTMAVIPSILVGFMAFRMIESSFGLFLLALWPATLCSFFSSVVAYYVYIKFAGTSQTILLFECISFAITIYFISLKSLFHNDFNDIKYIVKQSISK